jgi:hypothetical protein
MTETTRWLDDQLQSAPVIVAKRLAANDTAASGAHQAGPYIPRAAFAALFPGIDFSAEAIRDWPVRVVIDSHSGPLTDRHARLVWYRSKKEGRITQLGGARSPLLDEDATGSISTFAFSRTHDGIVCHVWVAKDDLGSQGFESTFGPIEPKKAIIWDPSKNSLPDVVETAGTPGCDLPREELPPSWLAKFPRGDEIVAFAVARHPCSKKSVDARILERRECEFKIFQSLERALAPTQIVSGFSSVEEFVKVANSVLQRRKSRGGKSLEYHAKAIFEEEGLVNGSDFSHSPTLQDGGAPDFLFPNTARYNDNTFPTNRLRMLAAKTSCKDRWRQVTKEAPRIQQKHLLTLQTGVSERQFRDMCDAGIRLVVPHGLHRSYPASIRSELMTFGNFLSELRTLIP